MLNIIYNATDCLMYQPNDAWFSDLENWRLDGESSSSSVSISDDLRLEPGLGDWPFSQDATDMLMLMNRISSKEWLRWKNCLRKHLIIIRLLIVVSLFCGLSFYLFHSQTRVFRNLNNLFKSRWNLIRCAYLLLISHPLKVFVCFVFSLWVPNKQGCPIYLPRHW